jgi:hypothetical protein
MHGNRIIYVYTAVLLNCGMIFAGCSKEATKGPTAVASLNVVNALPTSAPLILAQGSITSAIGTFYGIGSLSYGGSAVLTPKEGSETLYAVQRNSDTTSIGSKESELMFSDELKFIAGNLYSLFITGKDTTSPDFLFVADNVPLRTDSTVGIRFVNLSEGSENISVDIRSKANGSEVPSLAYKGNTNFMSYPATSSVSSYVFEFRDAVSGILLASYTLSGVNTDNSASANKVLFRNITIALIGQPPGGKVPQKCILVNDF